MDLSTHEIEQRVRALGQWFHNIDLRGVKTAPDDFLGDYPNIKWRNAASPPQRVEEFAEFCAEMTRRYR